MQALSAADASRASSYAGARLRAAAARPRMTPRRRVQTQAAKPKKGSGGGGSGGSSGYNTRTEAPPKKSFKAPPVSEGAAYSQETRTTILSLSKVGKVVPGGKEILSNINLSIFLGAKIGVLGANGAGKSTLMKLLAGVDKEHLGDLEFRPGTRVGYLPQEPKLDAGLTVLENVEPALAAVRATLAEYESVSAAMAAPGADVDALLAKMESLQAKIDACNGWEVDRTLERAMDALRCPPPESMVATLSGGERRRVALTRLLLEPTDMLLLDEPTNHLDAASVAWLERTLGEYKGTVVAITHDRYFLDNVAGWILELDRGKGIPFEGNYSAWLASKDARATGEEKARSAMSRTITRELEWMSASARGQQKKGKARARAYETLLDAYQSATGKADVLDCITIPPGPRLGGIVVEAAQLTKGHGGRLLIDGLDFQLPAGGIVGVVGANGAGKSTLFEMIMGSQVPDAGTLRVGETVRTMYVDQDRTLDPNKTVWEEITGGAEEVDLGGRKVNSRAYCSWYNFKGGDQQKKVGALSGGERNRLHLAKVLKSAGNLLLLDEPTNDLDVDTLRALEAAIESFVGCAVIISHDRWFLDRLATHVLAFEGDSKVVWFEGGYSEYEADRRKRQGGEPTRIKYRPMVTA